MGPRTSIRRTLLRGLLAGSFAAFALLTVGATAWSNTADTDRENITAEATAEIVLASAADLALQQSSSSNTVELGAEVTFTVIVRNDGPDPADALMLTDPLPVGLAYQSAGSSAGSCALEGDTVACALGPLEPDATVTVAITAITTELGTIVNTAQVGSDTADPDPANNSGGTTVDVVPPPAADLALEQTGPGSATVGDTLTYTLTVSNLGPDTAEAVRLTDDLPEQVSLVGASSDRGTCAPADARVDCELGPLPASEQATVTLLAYAHTAGTALNQVHVDTTTPDPDLGNNSGSASTEIVPPPAADLALQLTGAPETATVGDTLSYTLTITNVGPDTADDVSLTNVLPEQVSYQSATSDHGSCEQTEARIYCPLGRLSPDENATVTILAHADTAGTAVDNADVGATTPDPDPGNNSASASTEIVPPPAADLMLDGTAFPITVEAGAEVTYTFTVTNQGPDQARTVTLTDPLPPGLGNGSASTDAGTCERQDQTVVCMLGEVEPTGIVTVEITAVASELGTIVNTAYVTSETADPDPGNNEASIAVEVIPPAPLRPNIVVIMADDVPALDGRLIDYMPTVRSLFKEHGVTFTDFHGETPLCCPGRTGALTGQHTHNHGQVNNSGVRFDNTMTLATQLHSIGYHTLLVGKFMNAYGSCRGSSCAPNVPPGWDRWVAFKQAKYYDYGLYLDGGVTPESHGRDPSDYSTDVIAQKAVELIRSAPATQPIFAWVVPFSVHVPNAPAPRYATAPCPVANWKPPSWQEADVTDKPQYVQDKPLRPGAGQRLLKHCRGLLGVDDLVHSVRDELAAQGRLENTILIYTSDNGTLMGEHRLLEKTAPYQTQIPFYVSWPARLGTEPRQVSERLQNIDLAPTLCEIVGCSLGPYTNGQTHPDGTSFARLLLGEVGDLTRDAVISELPFRQGDTPAWFAVTTTGVSSLAGLGCEAAPVGGCRWHYVEYPVTGERELYDVSGGPCWAWRVGLLGDPCELENRVGDPQYAEIVAALDERLAALQAERGHPQ